MTWERCGYFFAAQDILFQEEYAMKGQTAIGATDTVCS